MTLNLQKWSKWDAEADGVISGIRASVAANGHSGNADIAKILYGAPQDAEFFAILYARFLQEFGKIPAVDAIARDYVMPHLTAIAASQQVSAATKQLAAAKLSFWTALVLGGLAVIFSAIQVYYAYISAHPQ